ncbi:hypothetical protein C8R41DRAFT_427400 [Lentinula lateritia]|uniref:SET domain-containing protein n=1 Tax=Lentinula lateritia TaxID=40482 RepID=A0ABQ8VVY3_9AGAR|nr:hypothetical protein C8R41DRAFT_427400 [Lentinula lateritia]
MPPERSPKKQSPSTPRKARTNGSGTTTELSSPKSPTKTQIKKTWSKWCADNRWDPDTDLGYKQKIGTQEVHRSDAMSYFCLKDYEIDTVPFITFENQHNENAPGRSYNLSNLRTLVSRKSAYLAGLNDDFDPKINEVDLLRKGWNLFRKENEKREERSKAKGRTRKALRIVEIFQRRQPNTDDEGREIIERPFGSWTTRVYEHGVYIGDWLNFQFDPDANEYGDFYESFIRFRPLNANWVWR